MGIGCVGNRLLGPMVNRQVRNVLIALRGNHVAKG